MRLLLFSDKNSSCISLLPILCSVLVSLTKRIVYATGVPAGSIYHYLNEMKEVSLFQMEVDTIHELKNGIKAS